MADKRTVKADGRTIAVYRTTVTILNKIKAYTGENIVDIIDKLAIQEFKKYDGKPLK